MQNPNLKIAILFTISPHQIRRIVWQRKEHSEQRICVVCSLCSFTAEQILIREFSIYSEISL